MRMENHKDDFSAYDFSGDDWKFDGQCVICLLPCKIIHPFIVVTAKCSLQEKKIFPFLEKSVAKFHAGKQEQASKYWFKRQEDKSIHQLANSYNLWSVSFAKLNLSQFFPFSQPQAEWWWFQRTRSSHVAQENNAVSRNQALNFYYMAILQILHPGWGRRQVYLL